ncbi:Pre-mRNA-splicing factor 18 [Geodia barretti]|nr:Pre-mRNA-splicing factor 18 [Geodia barretti]
MLKEWAAELNARPMTEKRSYQGKLDSATFKQTETYLQPLFKKLRKKSIAADILSFLADICGNILEREYVKANGIYLQMAIGNAPWPIGVTMVGIHARTGREKIFSQQIAHVLNDETQRKYIQGVKRLMTFCQRKYSTVPSNVWNTSNQELASLQPLSLLYPLSLSNVHPRKNIYTASSFRG